MPSNNDESIKILIEAWKKVVDVQQHFNDICMKVRNLFISVITALIAATAVVTKTVEDPFLVFSLVKVHIAILFIIAITGAAFLFYFMDRHWYHRLLLGAVKEGAELERLLSEKAIPLSLTSRIGEESPLLKEKHKFIYFLARIAFIKDDRLKKCGVVHSDAKVELFYKSVLFMFIALGIAFSVAGGVRSAGPKEDDGEQAVLDHAVPITPPSSAR